MFALTEPVLNFILSACSALLWFFLCIFFAMRKYNENSWAEWINCWLLLLLLHHHQWQPRPSFWNNQSLLIKYNIHYTVQVFYNIHYTVQVFTVFFFLGSCRLRVKNIAGYYSLLCVYLVSWLFAISYVFFFFDAVFSYWNWLLLELRGSFVCVYEFNALRKEKNKKQHEINMDIDIDMFIGWFFYLRVCVLIRSLNWWMTFAIHHFIC